MAQVLVPRRNALQIWARIQSRFVKAKKILWVWHPSSLDAPTVALVWAEAFAWAAGIHLPLWVPTLILLTLWVVYVVDRLLDARTGLRTGGFGRLRERHFFHWRHRPILVPLAAIAVAAAAWIVFNVVPSSAREPGSLLAAASLFYFTGVHTGRKVIPLLSKEFLVGTLFTTGCALPCWARAGFWQHRGLWPQVFVVGYFAILAWLNCRAINGWESVTGSTVGRSSFKPAVLTAVAGILFFVPMAARHPRYGALLLSGAASALLLAWLDRHRNRTSQLTLRTAADLVLLTPLLIVPLAPLLHR